MVSGLAWPSSTWNGMDPKGLALALLHEGPMVISSLGLLLLAAAGPLSRQHSSPAR
jgi:hypothetical protein